MWIRNCFRSLVPAVQVALAPSSRQLLAEGGIARAAAAAVGQRQRRMEIGGIRWMATEERDNTFERKTYSTNADELFSTRTEHRRKLYYLDLKRESGTGSCFVKITEKNMSNGVRSTIFIGLTDLEPLVDTFDMACKQGLGRASSEPFFTLHSKMFEGKVIEGMVKENAFGKSLEIREYYEQGIRAGMVSRIFVDLEAMPKLLSTFNDVLRTAKELWNACNNQELK